MAKRETVKNLKEVKDLSREVYKDIDNLDEKFDSVKDTLTDITLLKLNDICMNWGPEAPFTAELAYRRCVFAEDDMILICLSPFWATTDNICQYVKYI